MKIKLTILTLSILLVACKTTGIHVLDNPDGTSVKISYWNGNSQDNQDNIIKVGNKGSLMKVRHNVGFMTKYNASLKFDLGNGESVTFECNKSAQKRDYKGELEFSYNGDKRMECLEHIVSKSTVPVIQIGATATFGI